MLLKCHELATHGVHLMTCLTFSECKSTKKITMLILIVPAGLNEPKTPLAYQNCHTKTHGVVYYRENSKDVHFSLLCVFVSEWNCCIDPSFTQPINPSTPTLTTELCYCCSRLTFYSLTFWGNSQMAILYDYSLVKYLLN